MEGEGQAIKGCLWGLALVAPFWLAVAWAARRLLA